MHIAPYSYYLIGKTDAGGYDGGDADILTNWTFFGAGMPDSGGTIEIRDTRNDEVIDKLAWGTGDLDPETTAAPEHQSTQPNGSIERKASSGSTQASMESGGADEYEGNGEDSDDNSADFIIRTGRNPQNSTSETEPAPPPVPIDFAVADINSDGTLKISWTPDGYTTGTYDYFKIYRGLSEGNEEEYDQTVSSTTHEYWDAVAEGVTYYYKVSAVSTGAENNESSLTDSANAFSTDNTPPAKVTGLTALDTKKGNEIRLEWTPSSAQDIDKYGIYYKKKNPFDNLALADKSYYIAASTNITVVTGLEDGQLYHFSVTGKDVNGNEDKTQFEQVSSTPTDQTAPAKVIQNEPQNEGSGTKINLSWTAVSDSDLNGYKIFYTTDEPSGTIDVYTLDFFATVSPSLTQKMVTGLMGGVTYWFVLTSFDEVPNETSQIEAAYFKDKFPVNTPPQPLTTLTALNEGTGGKINLSWTASSESDVNVYKIYKATYPVLTGADYDCSVSTSLPTTKTITGLTNYVTYYFAITAEDVENNEGDLSSTSAAVPSDITPPSAPTGISVIKANYPGDGGALELSWANLLDVDFSSVTIYRSTSGLESPSYIGSSTSTTYTDTSLENGTTYYYILRAVDFSLNESTNTTNDGILCSGRPLDSYPPATPAGFAGMDMGTGGAVHLSWTENISDLDLKGYDIYRDSVPAAFISGATFYIDAAPSSAATYYYTIRARDTSDNLSVPSSVSLFVNDVSVLPPYDISAAAPATGRSARLSWKTAGSPRQIWLYRGTADSTTAVFGVEPSTRLAASATFYLDAGLTDKTSYYYGIKAVNYIYDSVVTKSTNTDIHAVFPCDILAPSTPTGLRTILAFGPSSTRDIKLRWEKPAVNEDGSLCDDLAGYEVEWLGSSGGVWGDNNVPVISGDTLEWTHTNLSAITYHYRIRACDGSAPVHYSLFSSSIAIYCDAVLNYAFEVDDVSAVTFTPNGDGIADSLDINFTLNQSSTTVELRVYSSTGGFVAELSSATYQAALSTSVAWSPSGLADGIYSVRIYINGSEFSSISVTIQGSAQIPPAANNYPNPFIMSRDGSTKIRWMMASPSPVKIAVYNAVGMLVKTWKISQNELTANYQQSGQWYELPWDGRNGKGRKVGSGIYICLIRGGGVDEKIKIAVIR
ncbi:fibronectin type III domain-containing protein [bacterium]|nr:fibronectin type III domain-containing protein [bacterium]